jgi:pyruvate carboxylase
MLRGDLGQPPGGWPAALQKRVLGDDTPITVRPGSLLGNEDLVASRERAEAQCGRALSDEEFASYLMYPKVFKGFADAQRRFGPVSALPTPIFFYGMQPGEEANITIEQGKTLVIQLIAIGDVEEDGKIRLFFEINGQPRVVTVADRKHETRQTRGRTADPTDENHIAAPMPGMVSALAVRPGQKVNTGDLLLTLEAMKMETAILAPRDCIVGELLVHAGESIEAKDLLLILESR